MNKTNVKKYLLRKQNKLNNYLQERNWWQEIVWKKNWREILHIIRKLSAAILQKELQRASKWRSRTELSLTLKGMRFAIWELEFYMIVLHKNILKKIKKWNSWRWRRYSNRWQLMVAVWNHFWSCNLYR